MNDKYTLDEKGNPVAEPDLMKWASWLETAEREVAKEQVGETIISTVFLGLDHNFTGRGQPVLWETMVFGGKLDQWQYRCSGSREQAEAMHARMVKEVKDAQDLHTHP